MSKITKLDVITTIEKALEVESGSLNENSHAEEVDKWDSLGLLSILVALDKLFEGKIANITEMSEADSISKVLVALQKHSLID